MRIRFTKTGSSRFMSHLDLMRCMTRSFSRAGMPVSFTQGFNPHPYLVFSAPLPLGISSLCEAVDIRLETEMSGEEIINRMKDAVPHGLTIYSAYDEKTSLNDIAYAKYRLDVPCYMSESMKAFLAKDVITVQKKSKKGIIRDIDLKTDSKYEICDKDDGSITLYVTLPCGADKNVGINLFTDAFMAFSGTSEMIFTERTDFFDSKMNVFE